MANGHKLLGLMVATALWLPAVEVLLPERTTAQTAPAPAIDAAARLAEAARLLEQGNQQFEVSQLQEAFQFYQQALNLYREPHVQSAFPKNSRQGEGNALRRLGNVYLALSQYDQAFEFYEQALEIAREVGDLAGEGAALNNLGNTYLGLGQYQQAIDFHQQSLEITREIGNRAGEGAVLGNLGDAYNYLGQYQQAIDFSQQSLEIFREISDRNGEGRALGIWGNAYNRLGQYQQAIDFYEQSLAIIRETGDRAVEGTVLGNLGNAYESLGQYQQAIDLYHQGLAIAREIGDLAGEGIALGNLGVAHRNLGNYQQAIESYQQALAVAQEISDRSAEGQWLSNIGALLMLQDQPELAIVFYKQSVNVREAIRGDLVSLSPDLQQSYTDTVTNNYRRLSELLLEADRVLEAQEVLDLLKLQELQDYNLQNVRGTAATQQGLDLWPAEQAILDLFNQSLATDPAFDFAAFLNSSAVVAQVEQLQRTARGQNLNPEQLVKLQDNLQQAGNAALLYPLILDDRLELILVTTSGLVRETIPVSRVELNAAILAFRSGLTDPRPSRRGDLLASAQQLHQWLIAPIADDLELAGAETILYAADGQLRYIPLAALHDGEQWLTQRYTINHITAASLTDFFPAEAAPFNILAGAFPAEGMDIDLGDRQEWFNGLPHAQTEVQNLVATVPNTTALFSAGFNRTTLEPELPRHTVLHLATHAEFRTGHPTDSFILLGNGDRLTLFDLNQWQLPHVDLVVLSACKTAVSGADLGNGEEILGFGYQIQQTGATAAISSLWSVNDGGTQVLMDAFYAALGNGYSKAEALQRAQQALITGDATVLAPTERSDVSARLIDEATLTGASATRTDLSHPFYWAPFILIGNGL